MLRDTLIYGVKLAFRFLSGLSGVICKILLSRFWFV